MTVTSGEKWRENEYSKNEKTPKQVRCQITNPIGIAVPEGKKEQI